MENKMKEWDLIAQKSGRRTPVVAGELEDGRLGLIGILRLCRVAKFWEDDIQIAQDIAHALVSR